MLLRPVRSVHDGYGDIFAVARHPYAFGRLAHADCIYNTRRLRFEVDNIDDIDVALASTLIAEYRDITLRADLQTIRSDATYHECLAVLDLAAVDGENRNPVVAIASYQGALPIGRESDMTRAGF